MVVLLINCLLYILAVGYFIVKDGIWNIHSFIWIWFAFIAFLGWLSYVDGVYIDMFGQQCFDIVSLGYYILSFIAYVYLFKPLRKISSAIVMADSVPCCGIFKFFIFVNFLLILFLICGTLPSVGKALIFGLGNVYSQMVHEGVSFIPEKLNTLINYYRSFELLLLCYTGYLLTIDKYKMLVLLGFVSIVILNTILAVLSASRGGMFFQIANYIFIYLLYRRQIQKKMRRCIKIIAVGGIGLVILISIVITMDRFSDGGDDDFALTQIERYFGEAFPNYGARVMGKAKSHPFGERFAPNIYEFFSGKKAYRAEFLSDMQSYYEQKTNLPIINFKTLVGDFYAEFGIIRGAIVLILIRFFFNNIIVSRHGNQNIPFYKVMIILFYFEFCFAGALDNTVYILSEKYYIVIAFVIVLVKYFGSKKCMYGEKT